MRCAVVIDIIDDDDDDDDDDNDDDDYADDDGKHLCYKNIFIYGDGATKLRQSLSGTSLRTPLGPKMTSE